MKSSKFVVQVILSHLVFFVLFLAITYKKSGGDIALIFFTATTFVLYAFIWVIIGFSRKKQHLGDIIIGVISTLILESTIVFFILP